MKKRAFPLLLAILILTAQTPHAFAVIASGKCGNSLTNNLTWTLGDDRTLTISGAGAMYSYTYKDLAPWYAYRDDVQTVVIENGVSNIGNWAFYKCKNLKNVVMSNSVSIIGDSAFVDCANLTNVTIPNSVVSIGKYAFQQCSNLTDITIPDTVTSLGAEAFYSCTNLKNVVMSNSVVSIESQTFQQCVKLETISIPNSVASIGEKAFDGCSHLKDVHYGGSWSEWTALQIGNGNDFLKNATIHCNTRTESQRPPIRQYSYAFANSREAFGYPMSYSFPVERFALVFGEQFAKQMKKMDFASNSYWSGNCYGIATTIGMFSRGSSKVRLSAFRNGAMFPVDLQVSDFNNEWGLTLTEFIEAMQISQYSVTFAAAANQNMNQLSSLLSAMSSFEEGDRGPLVICVYGNMNGYCGHALLPYYLDGQRLYVYDCNYPKDDNRYIEISENGWSYPISDGVTWSSSNGGDITYISYEIYLSDWENRGRVLGDPERLRQGIIFIDAADATISDSDGREMAVFQNGKMIRGISEAYPIAKLGVTADGSSGGPPQIAVWLPFNEEYRVTTKENATVSTFSGANSVKANETISVPLLSVLFGDVSAKQYFYEPVMWAVGRGITNGTSEETFSPGETCTRNHILTFLWRANGSPAASIANPFTDVDPSKDFGKAALWAYEKGLVSGGTFDGGKACTRAEVVMYLWKLAGRPSAGGSAFTDVLSNADYVQAVAWAVLREITKGTSTTTFNPSGVCTRGQIMTFLYRAYGQT